MEEVQGNSKETRDIFIFDNQVMLRSFRLAPRYKYGFQVPYDYNHAKKVDKKNKNTT